MPLICAADTFRAAAAEQVDAWAKRAAVDIVRSSPGADPASVVYDAVQAGKARNCDVVVVDTAGRLHTRRDLMSELGKIRRVVAREVDGAPHEVLMVLDATVGQNGIVQARQFLDVAGVTGIILTKLDGTAKGGIAIAIAEELGLPIRFSWTEFHSCINFVMKKGVTASGSIATTIPAPKRPSLATSCGINDLNSTVTADSTICNPTCLRRQIYRPQMAQHLQPTKNYKQH